MSKNKFLKILLPSIALTFGSQAIAFTVQEAVSHTLATSPDFLMQASKRDTVDKELRQSYAGYLPTLDLSAGWGEQYTDNPTTRFGNPLGEPIPAVPTPPDGTQTLNRTEFSLLASQMLFDGMAVYHDVEGHKARVRAESWRTNGTAQDVALSVVEAYLNVLYRRELVQLNRENLRAHETIFGQIHKRSEGGIGRRADLDQATGRVALARTNLMAEEANLRDAETEFLRRVGKTAPSQMIRPKMPHPFPASEQDAIERGLARHPILQASLEDLRVTQEAHKGARAPFAPRVDLQLEMSHNRNLDGTFGDSNDAYAMLRMKWNLFKGGKDLAKVCETASRMQEAQEVQNRAQRQVVESVKLAWSTYTTARRQLQYFKEHMDASLRTSDAYQKQFNIGQRTLLDLLDSQNELFTAKSAYINGRHTELLGMYRVLNATGYLTEHLGVALPRQVEPRPTGLTDGAMRFFDKTATIFDN